MIYGRGVYFIFILELLMYLFDFNVICIFNYKVYFIILEFICIEIIVEGCLINFFLKKVYNF